MAVGSKDAFQWSETAVTWALMADAWVVADSYRRLPWLVFKKRSHRRSVHAHNCCNIPAALTTPAFRGSLLAGRQTRK